MENQYKKLQNNIYSMISIFVKKKKIFIEYCMEKSPEEYMLRHSDIPG